MPSSRKMVGRIFFSRSSTSASASTRGTLPPLVIDDSSILRSLQGDGGHVLPDPRPGRHGHVDGEPVDLLEDRLPISPVPPDRPERRRVAAHGDTSSDAAATASYRMMAAMALNTSRSSRS